MPLISDTLRNLASALTIIALLIAGLVLGREILIPFTLAVVIAFMLNPIASRLARWGVPHPLSIVMTVVITSAAIGGFAALMSGEVLSLTTELDRYRSNIIQKVRSVTSASKEENVISKASEALERMGDAIESEFSNKAEPAAPSTSTTSPAIKIDVPQNASDHEHSPLAYLHFIGQPLAQATLTFLFTLFLLFQYKDLRDRAVRLAGTDNMSETTSAMGEAGARLSKLFLYQAILNSGFGLFIGVALAAIGIPSSALWGLLAAIMRFVPFIGSFISAIPPLLLAAAVDPGWTMFAATLALFVIAEPLAGHVLEPLLLGKKAGLSPFAMIASASFWTLLWGPIGLILAAPLTMVLVVLGRYVSGLELFTVLLGDEPALSPAQEFYHRLLADDVVSAAQQMESGFEEQSPGSLADTLVMPALALAASDERLGRLDGDQLNNIKSTMKELRVGALGASTETVDPDASILIIPGRGAIDSEASQFVAALLRRDNECRVAEISTSAGLTALASARSMIGADNIREIAIVTVGGMDPSQLGFIAKRAARDFPLSEVLIVNLAPRPSYAQPFSETPSADPVTTVRNVTLLLERFNCTRGEKTAGEAPERRSAPASPRHGGRVQAA